MTERWKIGMVGCGKLGLPVATAMALRGADVMGYDLDARRMNYGPQPYMEAGPSGAGDFNTWLAACAPDYVLSDRQVTGTLRFGTLEQVVAHADIIFVAVQTPHDPHYEGTEPLSGKPVDFDYRYLTQAVRLVVAAKRDDRPQVLAVISTCLPGTMAREVKPLLPANLRLVYTPQFIAMGTTMRDWLNPEFQLIGVDDEWAAERIAAYYVAALPGVLQQRMSVPSAELTKVAYNTFISTKIALANTVMEICHKVPGANCDDVTRALKAAYRRITGPTYMDGGQGDGGGCHPRDNIAMMWLANELDLSYSPFEAAMRGREQQARWLASLAAREARQRGLDIVVAGYAFKPGTNITTGSPALLEAQLLRRLYGQTPQLWDPHVDPEDSWRDPERWGPRVVLVGCRHPELPEALARITARGTVVVDPFRYCRPTADVDVVTVGVGPERVAPEPAPADDEEEELRAVVAMRANTVRLAEGGGHD